MTAKVKERTKDELVTLITGITCMGNNHRGIAVVDVAFHSKRKTFELEKSFEFYDLLDQVSKAIENDQYPSEIVAKMKQYAVLNTDSIVGQPKIIVESVETQYGMTLEGGSR